MIPIHQNVSRDIFIYNVEKFKLFLFVIEQNVKCLKKDTFGTDHASDSNFVDNLFKIFSVPKNSCERIPFENICSRIRKCYIFGNLRSEVGQQIFAVPILGRKVLL